MEAATTLSPMEVAKEYVKLTRRKRELDKALGHTKQAIELYESKVLELIESEQLPHSFSLDGARVFTRETLWASPVEGDHAALAEVLSELGMVEYLPRTVNSHSISAFVREHVNEETGEVEGIEPKLLDRLKITRQTKAVVNG